MSKLTSEAVNNKTILICDFSKLAHRGTDGSPNMNRSRLFRLTVTSLCNSRSNKGYNKRSHLTGIWLALWTHSKKSSSFYVQPWIFWFISTSPYPHNTPRSWQTGTELTRNACASNFWREINIRKCREQCRDRFQCKVETVTVFSDFVHLEGKWCIWLTLNFHRISPRGEILPSKLDRQNIS